MKRKRKRINNNNNNNNHKKKRKLNNNNNNNNNEIGIGKSNLEKSILLASNILRSKKTKIEYVIETNENKFKNKFFSNLLYVTIYHYNDFIIKIMDNQESPPSKYLDFFKNNKNKLIYINNLFISYKNDIKMNEYNPFPKDKYIFFVNFWNHLHKNKASMKILSNLTDDKPFLNRFKLHLPNLIEKILSEDINSDTGFDKLIQIIDDFIIGKVENFIES